MKTCRIPGCNESIQSVFDFCRKHWAMIPLHIKDEISLAYARAAREPEVYYATLEGAERIILEWQNDDGC